jgi:hypothetical protein
MNCDEYVVHFVSAHADDQLCGLERELAEEHLRGCSQCRMCLAEERALKADIRHCAGIVTAPADVRLRIRAALGEVRERRPKERSILASAGILLPTDAARPAVYSSRPRPVARVNSGRQAGPAASGRQRLALRPWRAQHLAQAALVLLVLLAVTVVSRVTFRSISGRLAADYPKSIPAFDFAVDRLNQLSEIFAPNVPPEAFSRDSDIIFAWVEEADPRRHGSSELPDISASYEKIQMPPEFCDFGLAGYRLVGGRVDQMPNGEPVTYTLYRNQTQSILSIGLKQSLSPPQGGNWVGTHSLYAYRGYSICLTIYPVGHFASIIVTRAPMIELLRDVAASDNSIRDG